MNLRPHHLLCTQGYEGKGYSDGFVSNMSRIVERLRNDAESKINIVFTTDYICSDCPQKAAEGICKSDEKVLRYDKAIIGLLDLQEGEYSYQDLIRRLNRILTEDKLEKICGDCEWYKNSACRENILGGKWIEKPSADFGSND